MRPWNDWREYAEKIGRYPADFTIVPERTALLPVDLQYCFASPDHGLGIQRKAQSPDTWKSWSANLTERVIPNNQRLLAFFRQHGLRIIHVHRGFLLPDAADELPELRRKFAKIEAETGSKPAWYFQIGSLEQQPLTEVAPLLGELVVTKRSYGAFATTGLDEILRHLGIDTLIITGVSTSACVESTARAAVDLGYNVVLIDDACGGGDLLLHDATMIIFSASLGRVLTTDEVLSELASSLGSSAVPEPD